MKRISMLAALAAIGGAGSAGAQVTETAVEAPGPAGPLRGTMTGPAVANAPAMLIIPGSGPTDRDGNNPHGVAAAPYRLLAEALAAAGVTAVRIDKRGMFASAGAVADGNAVTIADYAADVHAWTAAIQARTGARCVWLLGHSEGGLVALAAAQQRADICGLILVAAPGRPVGDTLRDQLRANPANAPVLDAAMAAIAQLEAGERVDAAGLHPALAPLFGPQVQGFLISLLSLDPTDLARRIERPILIVQGERDLQVGEEDGRRLAAANSRARLVLLPAVNHVLKQVTTDDRAANLVTYGDASLPLAEGVAEPIVEFLMLHRQRP